MRPDQGVMGAIGMAMLMMGIVAVCALIHRAAMGGAQEPPGRMRRMRSAGVLK